MSTSPVAPDQLRPIAVVPGRRKNGAVEFELDSADVRIEGDAELVMAVVERCTGRRTVAQIGDELADASGAVRELVQLLFEHDVLVDAPRAWELFHRRSSNRPGTQRAPSETAARERPSNAGRRERLRPTQARALDIAGVRRSGVGGGGEKVSFEELSTLLATMYSVGRDGHMTVPSAGALYDLRIDVVIRSGPPPLEAGLWRHDPRSRELVLVRAGRVEVRDLLVPHPVTDPMLERDEPILFVSADVERPSRKYSNRAYRFALLEAGAVMQSAYLAATDLDLAVRAVGGFFDERVQAELGLPAQTVAMVAMMVCA